MNIEQALTTILKYVQNGWDLIGSNLDEEWNAELFLAMATVSKEFLERVDTVAETRLTGIADTVKGLAEVYLPTKELLLSVEVHNGAYTELYKSYPFQAFTDTREYFDELAEKERIRKLEQEEALRIAVEVEERLTYERLRRKFENT